jgi:hypothetical protein
MKTFATVLALLALFALIPSPRCMAQTLPAPAPAAHSVTAAPVPADTAAFLATLSGAASKAPSGLTPAPLLKTSCGVDTDCPPGQLCCQACGQPDCGRACFVPWHKDQCPPFM